jgi:nucleotide-binding universal stress UspA family protein
MFKHILAPTDGSELANKAVKAAIRFCKTLNAELTLYQGMEEVPVFYGEGYGFAPEMVAQLEADIKAAIQANLDALRAEAAAEGVRCDIMVGEFDVVWEGIIDAAKKKNCDVIFMASHGRRGIAGLLLGSVTQKVLTHTKLPVMVFR